MDSALADNGPFELMIAEGRVRRIHSEEELRASVAELSTEIGVGRPRIVSLKAVRGHEVTFGVGGDMSFVQIARMSYEPPYLVSVSDRDARGEMTFWLHGIHHTEIRRRQLVPAAVALDVVSEFVFAGIRSRRVDWEEI
jgi:hypothetical protein